MVVILIVSIRASIVTQVLDKTTVTTATATSPPPLQWGAYVGDGSGSLADFESLVGKKVDIQADFESWDNSFPASFTPSVGKSGKKLLIFWEPSFGYNQINDGSHDDYIKNFASGAKAYGYPIILVPFDEMNLNEEAWGYGQNGNTADGFVMAWRHIHNLFSSVPNVKFAIDFNSKSVPNTSDNTFADYYPGDTYVDYVGLDGFNFGNPWQSFDEVFSAAVKEVSVFGKPLYILSMASADGPGKASWIFEGLGQSIKKYPRIMGWVWFNANKENDWRVNSNNASLESFKSIIP